MRSLFVDTVAVVPPNKALQPTVLLPLLYGKTALIPSEVKLATGNPLEKRTGKGARLARASRLTTN